MCWFVCLFVSIFKNLYLTMTCLYRLLLSKHRTCPSNIVFEPFQMTVLNESRAQKFTFNSPWNLKSPQQLSIKNTEKKFRLQQLACTMIKKVLYEQINWTWCPCLFTQSFPVQNYFDMDERAKNMPQDIRIQ